MILILWSIAILAGTGLAALLAGRKAPAMATGLGTIGTVVGGWTGLFGAASAWLGGAPGGIHWEWSLPVGALDLQLDSLSAFFILPILGLAMPAAIYGGESWKAWEKEKNLGAAWFFHNLLVAAMVLVVVAGNAVVFLMAWEIMALAAYFLVVFKDEKPAVREAGWSCLVATHWGTAFLVVLFLLMGQAAGSLDFHQWRMAGLETSGQTGWFFVLALIGFGATAGFLPLAGWLPEAHPAAPSHISALMSGVMIQTGIYGLVRLLACLGEPAPWWGWVLVAIGLTSGILGSWLALAQQDLKRLLAYSSVENTGIVALGLGLGLIGISAQAPVVAILGFSGALFHVVNHAIFKGLLFLGAGSVGHGTGTQDMERLGGLLQRMPWTGAAFLAGAAASCGLPPCNGFLSKLLILMGAFTGLATLELRWLAPLLATLAGLGLIGGLAAVGFTKVFGIVFLGEPRSAEADRATEAGPARRAMMGLLAIGCLAGGLFGSALLHFVTPILQILVKAPAEILELNLAGAARSLSMVFYGFLALLTLALALAALRRRLLAGRSVTRQPTWDGGYAQPVLRRQYTGSSFVQPLTHWFAGLLPPERRLKAPSGWFPAGVARATELPDCGRQKRFRPWFAALHRGLAAIRLRPSGGAPFQVLWITATLLVLLIWKLR